LLGIEFNYVFIYERFAFFKVFAGVAGGAKDQDGKDTGEIN
jgi:hypothetical protein